MNNPILMAMHRSNLSGALAPAKQALQMIRAAKNPQAALQTIMQRSPYYGQAQQLIAQAGGDANKAFRDLATQNGMDPESILRELM